MRRGADVCGSWGWMICCDDGLSEKSLGGRGEFSLVISLYLFDMMVKPDTDALLVKGSRCLFI